MTEWIHEWVYVEEGKVRTWLNAYVVVCIGVDRVEEWGGNELINVLLMSFVDPGFMSGGRWRRRH